MAFVPEGQADSSQARSASGIDVKRLRPGGTVEVIVSPSVSRIGSIVPLGRGHFPRDSRHFVPGYYRAVPPGQNQSPSAVQTIHKESITITDSDHIVVAQNAVSRDDQPRPMK